jgi:hypothetical protein
LDVPGGRLGQIGFAIGKRCKRLIGSASLRWIPA